jgi:hypothetical protein
MHFSSWILYLATGKRIHDTTSGFRAINQNLIKLFAEEYPTLFAGVIAVTMALRKGFKYSEIQVHFKPRAHGKSSIGKLKSFFYPIQTVLAVFGVCLRMNRSQKT